MAEQCIVCLEILDSAEPLQQLQGDDGGGGGGGPGGGASPADLSAPPPLALAAAAAASSASSTASTTTTTTKDLFETRDGNSESNENIAKIQICGHVLHDSCLREWTVKANSCPFCRQAFHQVEVYDKIGGSLLTTYKVEDKKQVAEFDPLAWLDENPEDEEESTPCPVCNTAEHEDVLLLCDGCDTPYHTHCIGLDEVPEGAWFCMECADRNGIAVQQIRNVVSRASGRGRNRGRRSGFFPRTQASMRTERTRARTDQWLGAWGQFSDRVHGALGIDLDSNDDEEGDGLREYRRSQQARERDRREWQRWQQRLSIASRAGARDVFARNLQGVVEQAPVSRRATPAAQEESPEVRAAWRAFERARAATPNGRKRKSRSTTASPVEPQPEPSRPLKRPRTRRIHTQADIGSSNAASATSSIHANERNGGVSNARSPPAMEEAPSFLSTLLKEVEQSVPSDDDTVRSVFGLPPAVDPLSPVTSPAGSARNSPRAMSLTPPPPQTPANATARSASRSPVLSLSSHIEPLYPPANYSPTRSTGESSDSESRTRRQRNGSPELRQPRPQRQLEVRLSRSQDSSPIRKTQLPLEVKDNINQVVRSALRPHWKSSQLSRDQYEAINRSVSHKLYEEVTDPSTVSEEAKRHWEKTATTEVARAVAELKT
ncbi:hypothetical protein N0V93_005790 [Gnomoniopsis smithogilvyi]|uniref:PHD and RING finger domain-containing protein n=1 Tax=Gnomoniopsis smithogilvyi TaxID=1191159 RepID=A0A9W8YTG6_9PEZI|nr:hypothetical protein N0V93_005790 [Gnomoniopsis smithogilvyi]